jgi:hypothetical protein
MGLCVCVITKRQVFQWLAIHWMAKKQHLLVLLSGSLRRYNQQGKK